MTSCIASLFIISVLSAVGIAPLDVSVLTKLGWPLLPCAPDITQPESLALRVASDSAFASSIWQASSKSSSLKSSGIEFSQGGMESAAAAAATSMGRVSVGAEGSGIGARALLGGGINAASSKSLETP